MAKTEGKELMIPITATAIELYEGGVLDAVLDKIEEKARAHNPDVSTRKGREAIRSNAALVTGSKTYLFKLGKDLTEDHRAKVKSTNDVRNRMEERLNTLKDEVRKPLTDYEQAEKENAARIRATIDEIKNASSAEHADKPAECLRDRMKEISSIKIDDSFGDFENEALIEMEKSINRFNDMIAASEKREADEKELAELRIQQAERDEKERKEKEAQYQKDRDDQIRKEAEDKANREAAEEQARVNREIEDQRNAERVEQERKDREAKETQERLEREKQDAENRAEMARMEERQRIEREQEQIRLDAEKREADTKHKAKINNAAVDALVKHAGLTKEQAKSAVKVIAQGKIATVSIHY